MNKEKMQNVVLTILTLKSGCVLLSGKYDTFDIALAILTGFVLTYLLWNRHAKGFE